MEYLRQYQDIRYLQVITNFIKLNEFYTLQDSDFEVKAFNDAVHALAKRDHVKVLSSNGVYHVNSFDLDSRYVDLDSSSLNHFFGSVSESNAFNKIVFPILSDKALDPQEITLLESIYLNNKVLIPSFGDENENQGNQKTGQFAGSYLTPKPFESDLRPMSTHLLCLNDKTRQKISDNLKNLDYQLHDYLKLILDENFPDSMKVYPMNLLKKSRRYLAD